MKIQGNHTCKRRVQGEALDDFHTTAKGDGDDGRLWGQCVDSDLAAASRNKLLHISELRFHHLQTGIRMSSDCVRCRIGKPGAG